MQISKKRVNPQLETQVEKMWYQLIIDIKTPEEAETVMSAMLSMTELTAITKRLAMAYWLAKGRSYENIKENLKVSSATIAAVQQEMKKPGWKMALSKVMAEEWATRMESKIKGIFKRRVVESAKE